MHCRNCNTVLPDQASVCVACGCNPYLGNKFCISCGAPTAPGAVFCVSCGVSLPSTTDPLGSLTNKKLVAGLCGIFLGGFGVHKFILGMNKPGLIMACLSVVGGLATCGVAYGAMHVLGLVEGIIYLTKSDAEFTQLYIEQKKEWL